MENLPLRHGHKYGGVRSINPHLRQTYKYGGVMEIRYLDETGKQIW